MYASFFALSSFGVLGAAPLAFADESASDLSVTTTANDDPVSLDGTTASTTFLDRRALESAPRKTSEELLRQVPGLTLVQHGSEGKGYQFFLRGFDATHGADLAININNLPINEWSGVHAQGYLDLNLLIPELVDSISVTKGPFALSQGAFAMAGSVDYQIAAPPLLHGATYAYTVGTTNRHRIFTLFNSSPHDFFAAEGTFDHGFGQRRGLRRATANASKRFAIGSRDDLTLLYFGGIADFDLPGAVRDIDVASGAIGFYDAYDQKLHGFSTRHLLAVKFRHFDDIWALDASAYSGYRKLNLRENFTGFLLDPKNGDRREQSEKRVPFGGSILATVTPLKNVNVYGGLQVRGDYLQQQEDHVGQDLEVLDTDRKFNATQVMISPLIGANYLPIPDLQLRAGVRFDVVYVTLHEQPHATSSFGATLVNNQPEVVPSEGWRWSASPRVVAKYHVADWLNLFAAYGRGLRPPEARAFRTERKVKRGLSDEVNLKGRTEMTTSDAFEVGASSYLFERLDVQVSVFGTFIEKESIFDHVAGTNLEYNGTQRIGVEGVVTADIFPWWNVSGDLTYVDAKFVKSGRRVPFAPPIVGALRTSLKTRWGLSGGARLLVVGSRPLPHGAKGATWVSLDATISYRYKGLTLTLEGENLLAQKIREGEYHYASYWKRGSSSWIPGLTTTAGSPIQGRLTLQYNFD